MSTGLHTVHVRVNDVATGQPTPVRIRFTDAEGTYYAPRGRLVNFANALSYGAGGNLALGNERYAYIDGTCEIDLPLRPLFVEVSKGFEYATLRQELRLGKGQMALRLAIERWADFRRARWYSGDIRCSMLSPHTALLEGAGEDLAVVNLLATVYGEKGSEDEIYPAYSNLTAFSGQQPALTMPGHMVVVNTFNTHPFLGSLALLNCHRVVYPLQFGKRYSFESLTEATWNGTLSDWCDQCHRKRGLVVWVVRHEHDTNETMATLGEALADLVLGKVDAMEPQHPADPEEWRRILNCGFRVPLVASSGKSTCNGNLGNVRTYARLQDGEELTYKNWIEALRAGRTFITNGPLLTFTVNNQDPGTLLQLSSVDQKLQINAEATSMIPFDRLQIVAGQDIVASVEAKGSPATACIDLEITVPDTPGGWLAARCMGERYLPNVEGGQSPVFAHTSPVYVQVAGRAPRADPQALAMLIDEFGAVRRWIEDEAYFESEKDRQRLRTIIDSAEEELNSRRVT